MLAGIDTHKDTLAVAVIDPVGRPLVVTDLANTEAGFDELEALLAEHAVDRVGIEGSGNYGRGAAVRLVLAGGMQVVEVPPSMTSRERSSRPGQGKTDPVDSLAIARITAREPALPPVRLAVGEAADLRAMADYRAQLVNERTALANRTHAELHGLLPGYQVTVPRLTAPTFIAAATDLLREDSRIRAQLTRRRLTRLTELTDEIKELTALISTTMDTVDTGLTDLYGVGPVGAATILGEVADIRRYRSRHAFAAANGTAPIPASSGRTSRHRLNRAGNRTLNRVLYTMAITQIRGDTEGRAYYQRKRAEGKTGREALRCLKRRLSDLICKTMHADLAAQHVTPTPEPTDPANATTVDIGAHPGCHLLVVTGPTNVEHLLVTCPPPTPAVSRPAAARWNGSAAPALQLTTQARARGRHTIAVSASPLLRTAGVLPPRRAAGASAPSPRSRGDQSPSGARRPAANGPGSSDEPQHQD